MSTYFQKKDWVCLVEPAAIERLRQGRNPHGELRETLWRQICVVGKKEGISVELMSVDEEAARGGYWRGGHHTYHVKFAWEDLNDRDGLCELFKYEPVIVFNKLISMLEMYRQFMPHLREALAA